MTNNDNSDDPLVCDLNDEESNSTPESENETYEGRNMIPVFITKGIFTKMIMIKKILKSKMNL